MPNGAHRKTVQVTLAGSGTSLKPKVDPDVVVADHGFGWELLWVPAPGEQGWAFKRIALADPDHSPLPNPPFTHVVVEPNVITVHDKNDEAKEWMYAICVEKDGTAYWSDDPIINNKGGGG